MCVWGGGGGIVSSRSLEAFYGTVCELCAWMGSGVGVGGVGGEGEIERRSSYENYTGKCQLLCLCLSVCLCLSLSLSLCLCLSVCLSVCLSYLTRLIFLWPWICLSLSVSISISPPHPPPPTHPYLSTTANRLTPTPTDLQPSLPPTLLLI